MSDLLIYLVHSRLIIHSLKRYDGPDDLLPSRSGGFENIALVGDVLRL